MKRFLTFPGSKKLFRYKKKSPILILEQADPLTSHNDSLLDPNGVPLSTPSVVAYYYLLHVSQLNATLIVSKKPRVDFGVTHNKFWCLSYPRSVFKHSMVAMDHFRKLFCPTNHQYFQYVTRPWNEIKLMQIVPRMSHRLYSMIIYCNWSFLILQLRTAFRVNGLFQPRLGFK